MPRCPACGFESPGTAQWCDFCKEPFNRRPKEAPRPGPAPQPAPTPKGPSAALDGLPTEVAQAVASLAEKAKKDKNIQIPPELLKIDTGGSIPMAPAWYRYAAWAVLGIWFIFMMVQLALFKAKQSAREDDAAIQRRFQSGQPEK